MEQSPLHYSLLQLKRPFVGDRGLPALESRKWGRILILKISWLELMDGNPVVAALLYEAVKLSFFLWMTTQEPGQIKRGVRACVWVAVRRKACYEKCRSVYVSVI